MLIAADLDKLEKKALEQRRIHELGETSPIGEKIFSLLENVYSAYIVLYPLKTNKVAGLTRKQGDWIQVFINTSFNNSFQYFAAAHELYHLIDFREKDEDKFVICDSKDINENIDETSNIVEELKANYFAAAFLMPRTVIVDRFSNLKDSNFREEDIVLEIIKLQYEYEIPFKTILKRLSETKMISKNQYNDLAAHDSKVLDFCRMLDINLCNKVLNLEDRSKRKYHTLNVPKMAFDVYRSNMITISKLDSIIKIYDKTLEDFQILEEKIEPINFDLSGFGTGEDDGFEGED